MEPDVVDRALRRDITVSGNDLRGSVELLRVIIYITGVDWVSAGSCGPGAHLY